MADQETQFAWPLAFDLSDIGGSTRSLGCRQLIPPGQWDAQTALHEKANLLTARNKFAAYWGIAKIY
jgi:hypothetical protein